MAWGELFAAVEAYNNNKNLAYYGSFVGYETYLSPSIDPTNASSLACSLKTQIKTCSPARVGWNATAVPPYYSTDWGGYSGYFSDPDGLLREIAWNPPLRLDGVTAGPVFCFCPKASRYCAGLAALCKTSSISRAGALSIRTIWQALQSWVMVLPLSDLRESLWQR